MQTTYRGLSIGAWLILISAVIGVPFLILGAVLMLTLGATPSTIDVLARQPLMLVLLAVSGLATILSIILFFLGLVLYVLLPSLSPRTARVDYGSYRTVLACFLLAFALATILQGVFLLGQSLFAFVRAPSPLAGELTPSTLIAAIVSTEISLLFVLWIRIIRPGVITLGEMGLTNERLGIRMTLGVATGIAIFVAAGIIEFVLSQLGIQQTQIRQFESVKNASLFEFLILLLGGAVLAPFVEELFFRGYVFKGLADKKGVTQALLSSALFFSIVHGNLEAALPIFVIGLILAYVFYQTGSVIPPMIGHSINNGIAFTVLYFGLA